MKKIIVLAVIAILSCFAAGAVASDYPNKTVHIICPYSPGGGSDIMVRTIAQIIEENKLMPVPVVVSNKTGGAGMIGKTFVFKRPADGYYLTLADLGHVIHPIVTPSAAWDLDDWEFLANMVFDFNVLAVRAGTYESLDELIEAARQKQAPLSAGGTGSAGGPDSVCTLKLNRAAGIKMNYVPMKGGGEVVAALLGGHIDMGWFNPAEILGQVEAGKARILAVTADKRIRSLPEVPTFKELGYDFTYLQQRGLCTKKGVPRERIDYLVNVLAKVRQTEAWQSYLDKYMQEDGWLGPEAFRQWMEEAKLEFLEIMKIMKQQQAGN